MTCLGFSVWWCYCAQCAPLRQFEGTVHGAHGKPLQISGKTQHLDLQWSEARGRACFIVIVGLESPPCLIGMDIMRPLRVHIDVTNGTATPAQPDPQTVYLNAAQSQQQRKKMPLQGADLPAVETACPPPNQPQRKKMPLPEIGLSTLGAARPPQSQQQREKMPLSEADLAAVGAACPPQTQPQRMKMPLAEVGSPAVGAASPPQFSQQRKEILLPEIYPSTIRAAYSSHPQPQRREMPLPETEILAPPIAEISPPAASAAALPGEPPSNASLSTTSQCAAAPTPLAELCCYKQQTSLQRRLASFAATTRGLPRTSCFVLATLCRLL